MNAHLLREWRRLVCGDETIINLGEVARRDASCDEGSGHGHPPVASGRRVLVIGNHDEDELDALAEAEARERGRRCTPRSASRRASPGSSIGEEALTQRAAGNLRVLDGRPDRVGEFST